MGVALADVRAMDAADPLRERRDRFVLPDGVIYLDGNSLGALPKATAGRVQDVLAREWGQGLIRSWNAADWIGAPARIAAKIAPLIGAASDEVTVADSTSVNLFKLIAAAVRHLPDRPVILTEAGNFPTDLYIAAGAAELIGRTVRAVPADEVEAAIGPDVAVVVLTQVHYKSGARRDMARITQAAHRAGALIIWDLSHSAGAVEVDLNAAGADLAIGCGYKFLNGGPGAPAYLFVARRHQALLTSPLTGWMGHASPFAFEDAFTPAEGIDRFLCGTPAILAMAALEAGIGEFEGLAMADVAEKGQRLCTLFIELVEQRCSGYGLGLVTPRQPAARGSHVSFRHEQAYPIMQAMIERGVIGDFREPDILRCGFTGLYVGYEDVWRTVETLRDILATQAHREARFWVRSRVT